MDGPKPRRGRPPLASPSARAADAVEKALTARERLLQAVTPTLALPDAIPPAEEIIAGTGPNDHPNVRRNIVWLKFCGLKPRAIAERTGLAVSSVETFIKSPGFFSYYEHERAAMLSRVDEAMRERLQEIVMEAIEVKIDLMRHTKREALQNQIATELIELGSRALQVGSGAASDLIKAIHEKAVKEKRDGTRVQTQRVTLSGSPQAVAAAIGRRDGDGPAGDRPPTGPVDSGSADGADTGAPETPAAAGSTGDHPGDDRSGV
jgi:hypothetical protein